MHTRTIHCDGFLREDGLWDIEARMVDTKAYAYDEPDRGPRKPGDPVHEMAVRLTVDAEMTVLAIEVEMPSTPYRACLAAAPAFQSLIGARIGGGWRKAVNAAVGGTLGCTHVRELLFPMATVAFQTIGGWSEDASAAQALPPPSSGTRPYFIDGCKGWATDGEVVARFYPEYAVRRSAS